MPTDFNDAELEAYLDESLDCDRANEIEICLRNDQELLARLSHINARRDAGVHTLGEIWRRHQIGVPSFSTMEAYVDGSLSAGEADYISFRIETLKCRFTIALEQDVLAQRSEDAQHTASRRKKIHQKSARLLRKEEPDS